MKLFFLMFLVVPLLEIYFLIKMGGMVGVGLTILFVLSTAMLGAVLVRAQGFAAFARAQTQLAQGRLPTWELLEGLVLFVAGALLLTPGFFTDAVGFVLLIPPCRRKMIIWASQRNVFVNRSAHTVYEQTDAPFDSPPAPQSQRVIDQRVIDATHEKID